jgi:integrase
MVERLTDNFIKSITPPASGNRVTYDSEVRGFGIRVTAKGAKSFVLNYRFDDPDEPGRRSSEYRYTIGNYGPHDWSLQAARKEASAWRRKIDRGESHPLAERNARKAAVKAIRQAETYAQAVEDYIKREQKGRRGNATADEIRRVLLKEGAAWSGRSMKTIKPAEISALLDGIRDDGRRYLANRMYAYLQTFFKWCQRADVGIVGVSPMIGLVRPWEGEESRDVSFTDDELARLWRAGDAIGGVGSPFLKLLILTGKRKSALASMRWEEIDDDGLWTPRGDRRRKKSNKRLHAIPLPGLAMRVLQPLRGNSDYGPVFPGRTHGSVICPGTALQNRVKQESGVEKFYWHAVRHTVETKLAELRILPHIRDIILDHAPARGAGAGYDHYSYGPEIREALEKWAKHIEGLVTSGDVALLR